MAKIHHIFINYNVLTNNFHTYQLFTSSSPCFLPIVFPILPPPFLPSPPRFLAVSVSLSCYLLRAVWPSSPRCLACFISLSCQLLRSVLLSSPRCLASFVSLSCQLLRSILLSSPRCLAGFVSLSCQLRHAVLVSHMPRTCKLFSSLSNPAHALQRSRKGPSTSENMPFLVQEKALLCARQAYSRFVFVTI